MHSHTITQQVSPYDFAVIKGARRLPCPRCICLHAALLNDKHQTNTLRPTDDKHASFPTKILGSDSTSTARCTMNLDNAGWVRDRVVAFRSYKAPKFTQHPLCRLNTIAQLPARDFELGHGYIQGLCQQDFLL